MNVHRSLPIKRFDIRVCWGVLRFVDIFLSSGDMIVGCAWITWGFVWMYLSSSKMIQKGDLL